MLAFGGGRGFEKAPDGFAMSLPKGSDFLLQAHFHPTGKAETERSAIGLYFTQKPPDREMASVELPALFGFGAGINIPAGESNFVVRLVHAAGRHRGASTFGPRALRRQGDEGHGDAPRRHEQAAHLDPRLGFQLAGFLSLQGSGHAAEGHARRRATAIQQLRGEPAQPEQSAAACVVGRAIIRRDGHGRPAVRDPEQGRRARRASGADQSRPGRDSEGRG